MHTENQQATDQANEGRQPQDAAQPDVQPNAQPNVQPATPSDAVDGLKDKKPEELTPDELRLMADTMPGEGPGD